MSYKVRMQCVLRECGCSLERALAWCWEQPGAMHRPQPCGTGSLSAALVALGSLVQSHRLAFLSSSTVSCFTWLDFLDEPQTTFTLDCVWSTLHWWRNLLLSLRGPAQVLWNCVWSLRAQLLTLGFPSESNPAIASSCHHHRPSPSVWADIWHHGIVLTPISTFNRALVVYSIQHHHKEQKDHLYLIKR